MVKTITIADDVYEALLEIKGNKSFSEVIRELLKKEKGNYWVLLRIFGILNEKEYKEVREKVKEIEKLFEEWEQSLMQI